MRIRELLPEDYEDSVKLIEEFSALEELSPLSMDWVDIEESTATYIWCLELENMSEKPLGFLSYKKLILPNQVDFIYIVKIYVLKTHRGKSPILIEEKRVSEILFREIDRKDINILTLESACTDLDVYYEKLGFKYNPDISRKFSSRIDTKKREIMYRKKEEISLSEAEKNMFGNL